MTDEISPRQVPDDLRVPWDWIDLLVFAAIAFAGELACTMIVAAIFGAFGFRLADLRNAPDKYLPGIAVTVLLNVLLLVYLAAQIRLRVRAPFWRTIGWRRIALRTQSGFGTYSGFILGGVLLQVLVMLASGVFVPKHAPPIQAVFEDRTATILFMTVAVLLAPLAEETFFRGYIYPVAARSFGIPGGIIFTGVIFGLLHAQQLWGAWWQIFLLVLVGIVLTCARAASRSVVASYLVHLSYNSAQVAVFMVSSHFLRTLPHAH